jgi:uncharacterized membrane protein
VSDRTSTQCKTSTKAAICDVGTTPLGDTAALVQTQSAGPVGHIWTFSRNNSLSPRQMVFAYGLLLGGTLALAIQWTAAGAWFVMPYAVIEVAVCSWLIMRHLRHAHDYDRIELSDGCLVITKRRGSVTTNQVLNALWARIQLEDATHPRLQILYAGNVINVGEHAMVERRRCVAAEIQAQLNELTHGRR